MVSVIQAGRCNLFASSDIEFLGEVGAVFSHLYMDSLVLPIGWNNVVRDAGFHRDADCLSSPLCGSEYVWFAKYRPQ